MVLITWNRNGFNATKKQDGNTSNMPVPDLKTKKISYYTHSLCIIFSKQNSTCDPLLKKV